MRLTAARILVDSLLAKGGDVVFGHPGGVVLPLSNIRGV